MLFPPFDCMWEAITLFPPFDSRREAIMLFPPFDSRREDETRVQMYLAAANKHNTLMNEANHLQGCDRHLLGLSCVAKEDGLPLPDLYTDPSFTKSGGGGSYVLSTSFVGYTPIYGCVAPMMEDGYGTFYKIEADKIVPAISVWKSSPHTDTVRFCEALFQSLDEMGNLLQKSKL